MIKVLIVDDEPLARENLRVFLQEQSDIEIVGECSNAVEGIGAVHKPVSYTHLTLPTTPYV